MTKTQTFEKSPQSATTTEKLPDSSWDQISNYVSILTSEPDFIAYVEDQGIDSHTMEYADALSQYTEASISQQEELLDEHTATQMRLVANAPYITHASLKINELNDRRKKGNRLPEQEWTEFNNLKKQAVWYNQMLSEYMYINKDESFSEISQAIGDQVLDQFPKDTHAAATTIEGIIRGTRTESATRHLLDKIGAPYRPASIEEDLRGADLVLALSDNEYHIDIKRSLDQLAENDGGYKFEESHKIYSIYQDKRGHKRILLFPAFTDEDLLDKLHLSDKTINERKDLISAQLMLAVREINQ